jgi:hypothetical protein
MENRAEEGDVTAAASYLPAIETALEPASAELAAIVAAL